MAITAEKIILALGEIEHLQEKFATQFPDLEWAKARLEDTQMILKVVQDEELLEAYAARAQKRLGTLPLDPEPYRNTNNSQRYPDWNTAQMVANEDWVFAPRREYSQNEEDYA